MARGIQWFGWVPDHPDQRDHYYTPPIEAPSVVPPWVDLRPGFPPVFNQGNLFGFTVYESFLSRQVAGTGRVPMPAREEQVVGSHAVLAVGYDDARQWFICRNSWGAGWGMAGYFTLPYPYLTQESLSSDFWTIRVAL